MNLDWKHIVTLCGSQRDGFEQFCCHLAENESTAEGGVFIRKGKPDAGVECYRVLPTGDEIAWQAKYVLSAGNDLWSQLDDSVKTALAKHPRLAKYYVCVPVDLPDARLAGQASAHEKWTKRVAKWGDWATKRKMSVSFVWWGSHEMLAKLALPRNANLVKMWFGATVLDSQWFNLKFAEAIAAAGPRYTPEVNVELPILEKFHALGRTAEWLSRVKARALEVHKAARLSAYELRNLGDAGEIVEKVFHSSQLVASAIRETAVDPAAPTSFGGVLESIRTVRVALQRAVAKLDEAVQSEDGTANGSEAHSYTQNPFRSMQFRLRDMDNILGRTSEFLASTSAIAESRVLILAGAAGMGKTHLLCDLAARRLKANRPTILLMGQRFTHRGEPWAQALQQLDLPRLSAEEFVDCLEVAARFSNARALLIVDAINEGEGAFIWPGHMGPFLQLVARSSWISVVISVRSSYEERILPPITLKTATRIDHVGFDKHEYDASKTFFSFYGIELPSSPILGPEYRTPLFLKTLCVGLREGGHTRIPRGFHGISKIFKWYTSAINGKLSVILNFDPHSALVQKALHAVVSAFPSHQKQWVSRERAKELVDSFLPSRAFDKSLYHGLVSEGLLVVDILPSDEGDNQEFVHLAYERLADHLSAELLLDGGLGDESLLACQVTALTFGVLESLFIRVPEVMGEELMELLPRVLEHFQWAEAFRQSLVWREPGAFTPSTLGWFNKSIRGAQDEVDTVEVVLTLSGVPDHPWNGKFLDRQLREKPMAERDAWWSISTHILYERPQSAVHRIIDWASSVEPGSELDDDVVQLISQTLGWMFSSANRYLRDRATKGCMNLLSGREAHAARLVREFAAVDDLYIRERVLAVAYGVAMRCQDKDRIRALAQAVMETVFEGGEVVPHLLLRDYARGIVERAHWLTPYSEEAMTRVRPPYGGKWPRIPSVKTIKALESSCKSREEHAYGAWRIASSVLDDDFARYVIGTNSWVTDWLSLRLSQPKWRSYDEEIQAFVAALTPAQAAKWGTYREAQSTLSDLRFKENLFDRLLFGEDETKRASSLSLGAAREAAAQARKALLSCLGPSQAKWLRDIWRSRQSATGDTPPKFDLRLMQRHILKRVFDLGWTPERFDDFDSRVIGTKGREAAKAERIGKKYQWIAYHEICALVADNFQYRPNDRTGTYEGPWQDFFRDIDPSHAVSESQADPGFLGSWWSLAQPEEWGDGLDARSWLKNVSAFHPPQQLLVGKDKGGLSWLVADIFVRESRPVPEGMEREDVESRSTWCDFTGFLLRRSDMDAFLSWAERVDFWGRWMPQVPSSHGMFLGEYLWSPAWKYVNDAHYEDGEWIRPEKACPVLVRPMAFEYHEESSGFDCSIDSSFKLRLPDAKVAAGLGVRWSGRGSDFWDATGQLVSTDPSAFERGPSALLLRQDRFEEYTAKGDLGICWTILGERAAYLSGPMRHLGSVRISGACALLEGHIHGFTHFIWDDRQQPLSKAILETKRF